MLKHSNAIRQILIKILWNSQTELSRDDDLQRI